MVGPHTYQYHLVLTPANVSSARKQVNSGWSVKNVKSGGVLFAQVMSVEFHEFVGKCDNFHWFCNTCNVGIDELWNQEETPKQVPEPILKSIDSKITDVHEIVKDMKSKVTCIESESNDMKKSYVDMFKASAATVSKANNVDLGRKSTQKDREALSEYADRERSRCIIIHGVPESICLRDS